MKMRVNIAVLIVLWCAAISITIVLRQPLCLFLPYLVFSVNEIAYYYSGCSLFPSQDITAHFYDLSMIPTYLGMVQRNYSEGYYPDDDYTISPKQAENNKFDKILELLQAKAGDVILDMGCGTGTFGEYCAGKNIRVIGMTLSHEQREICISKGIETYVADYTRYHSFLKGKVDHFVLLGSSEHLDGGPFNDPQSYVNKFEKVKHVFGLCKRYARDMDGRRNRIFYSALHMNDANSAFAKSWEAHIMQRTFGGTYMSNTKDISVQKAGEEQGIKTVLVRDSTKEYYLATALDETHFGTPCCWYSPLMLMLLLGTLIYPFCIYMYVYAVCGLWMWMFDGRLHFCHNKQYLLKDEKNRPCSLVWYVGEM